MATPSNADEACAINIGNIDCNAVSEDDIVDWLKLLGEVKSISRRYNPTTNETGYRLVFRHAATANLAVQFVDGVVFRDKERPLSITSSVFTKSAKIGSSGISGEAMEDSGGASAPPAGVDNAADQRVAQGRTILPSNQQMPDDLQMDFQLVCTIPQLLEAERIASGADDVSTDDSLFALGPELLHGSQEAFKTLQELQLKYICVRREAEELDTKLEAKRAHVNELLLGGHNRRQSDGTRSPPPGAVGGWGSQAAAESVELATSLIPLRITTTATPPKSLLVTSSLALFQSIHDSFGPVARLECSSSADGASLSIVVEFARRQQAQIALRVLQKSASSTKLGQKRIRDEHDQPREDQSEHVNLLRSIGTWTEGAVRLSTRDSSSRTTLRSMDQTSLRQAQVLVDSWR